MSAADVRRQVRTVRNQINKGSKYLLMDEAENVPNSFFLRRPSGIMQLDIDTGGGLPAGGLAYVSGRDGVGKTLLLYHYFAMHQRLYGDEASICYVPVEFLPDYKFMRAVGCQVAMPDKMLEQINIDRRDRRLPGLTDAERAELKSQAGCFEILRAATAEELLDKLLIAYASNAFHIIAMDSVSVVQASAEASVKSLAKPPQQAANAGLLTRFLQHYHPLTLGLNDNLPNTTMIFTAQARANRRKSEMATYVAKYMPDETTDTGAYSARHGKLVNIDLVRGEKIKANSSSGAAVIGKDIKWKITKAKAGARDNIEGRYGFRYDTPGDVLPHLVSTAIQHGVARETDGNIAFLDTLTGGPLPAPDGSVMENIPGVDGLRHYLASMSGAEAIIRREILSAAGIGTCLYQETGFSPSPSPQKAKPVKRVKRVARKSTSSATTSK